MAAEMSGRRFSDHLRGGVKNNLGRGVHLLNDQLREFEDSKFSRVAEIDWARNS